MHDVEIYPDPQGLAEAYAEYIARSAEEAVAARGLFTLALSGGETPRPAYARLARETLASRIDWSRTHLFWGDERCVPPDHPESNYRMAREALLDDIPIPVEHIHRMRGELPPEVGAEDYERTLRDFFIDHLGVNETPRFDLVLLGMGADGHTASLFPHSPALGDAARWVAPTYFESHRQWRLTLTVPVLNAADRVALYVAGKGKADRLRQVLHGPYQPDVQPVQLMQPAHGELRWFLDAAAAWQL